MSWDVIIINSSEKHSIEEVWEDNKIPSFGKRIEIQNKINALYPDTDWTDPSYAHLDNGIYVGHISLGDNEILDGNFMLHIYGGSDPYELIISLCKKYNWTAYDTTTSEYIDNDNPNNEGWNEFQAFRQRIVNQVGGQIGGQSKFIRRKKWWQFWK